jgi:hypothetical protein
MGQPVYVNKQVRNDLLWFVDMVERLEGVRILSTEVWTAFDADLEIFGDACKIGLAFWAPKLRAAYIGDPIITPDEPFNIFITRQSPSSLPCNGHHRSLLCLSDLRSIPIRQIP